MANINEILARAAALRDETALNSISPERAGSIMYDTLIALNELWLQQGAALVISKIYASVAAMEADTDPVSDISGKPLRPGQIVVIASSDSDNGSVYRYNGPDSPSWSLVGKIGNLEIVSVSPNTQSGGYNLNVGDTSINTASQDEVRHISGGVYQDNNPVIEQGTISSAGIDVDVSTRIRTKEYLKCESLTINAGIGKVSVFGYSDDIFIGNEDWKTGTNTIKIEGATKYRIVFAKTNDGAISPSDFASLGVVITEHIVGEISENSTKDRDYSNFLVGNFNEFGIISNRAIGQDGTVEINNNFSCTCPISISNGIYILGITKSSVDGTTRIHGYKNGSWVKQLNKIDSGQSGHLSCLFEIENNEIDEIRISYRTSSTTLERIQYAVISRINVLDVHLEKGFYSEDSNRYGIFTDKTLFSRINCKPILLNGADTIAIHSNKELYSKSIIVYFRSENGGAISSTEIPNVESDIFISVPSASYYVDIEVSGTNIETTSTVDGKAIGQDGSIEDNQSYSYADFVSVTNGKFILEISKSNADGITRIHGYKNGSWVKQITMINSGQSGAIACAFKIENNEIDEIRISYRNTSTNITKLLYLTSSDSVKDTLSVHLYNSSSIPEEGKRIYRNSGNPIINPFNVGGPDELLTCMCYMLPPNYTYNKNKIPLIVWFDGSANYPTITSSFSQNKLPGLSYMRDEGFAIMQVFAWGADYAVSCPDCGKDMPYPTRTCLRTIKSAIEYMVDRYNIDADNVHIASKSFGGIMATYLSLNPIYPLKSIGMFSPCIDVLSMRGRFLGGRLALIKDLDLQGEYVEDFKDITESGETQTGVENYFFSPRCQNLWLDNFEKLMSINPAWLFVCEAGYGDKYQESLENARHWWNTDGTYVEDKYNALVYTHTNRHRIGKIPCKLWIGNHDVDTPHQIMLEYENQLKNCGCYTEDTLIEGGGHSSPDFGDMQPVTTKLGIYYESVAIGWRENIEWIRRNSVGDI